MQHIAIDLGGRKSQFCIRTSAGEIEREGPISTERLPKFLEKEPESVVVMESCTEAFTVASHAREVGHEAIVVPAFMVRSLGIGSRQTKTDERDARILSEVSVKIALGSIHIPSMDSRELKHRCQFREGLVRSRTEHVNRVRAYLRYHLLRPKGGAMSTFTTRVRTCLALANHTLLDYLEEALELIDDLTARIKKANAMLKGLADSHPVTNRLMSTPGVGPVTAIRFMATIDDPSRFRDSRHVGAYLGLTPGENSSGARKQRLGITKAGSATCRWALIQAAWSLWRTRPMDPMVQWAQAIALRRGKRIAIVALARKLAGVLFALWRDETSYCPQVISETTAKTSDENDGQQTMMIAT